MSTMKVNIAIKLYEDSGKLEAYAVGANGVDDANLREWIEFTDGPPGHYSAICWYSGVVEIEIPDYANPRPLGAVVVERHDAEGGVE